jgi:hypothetical protein
MDLPELARRARAALAEAHSVTLLIQGIGRNAVNAPTVVLHDKNGDPTFLCEAGSPVTPAARRGCPALLSIALDGADGNLSVLLCGRLVRLGVERVDGVPVDIVGLEPERVLVECDDPEQAAVVQYCVPLELYRDAAPDPLVDCAARIVAHTNESHQAQLRQCVARRMRVPVGEIAGVTLAELGPDAALLQWVDAQGSHTMRLRFPARATKPDELAGLLRMRLAAPGPDR